MPRTYLFSSPPGLPDRATLLDQLGRHTRFVRLSKLALVSFIALLLAAVVLLPLLRGDSAGVRIAFVTAGDAPETMPAMLHPRFQGADAKQQPYTVTADSAIQQDADTILLNRVQADMMLRGSAWLSVSAARGTMKLSQKTLSLAGDVQVFHDGGYTFRTERVEVNMAAGSAHGDTKLEGQGPMGYIRAAHFEAYDRGQRLVFGGPVSLTIRPGGKHG